MLDKIKEVYSRVSSNEGTLFTYAFAYSLIVGLAPFLIVAVVFVGNYFFSVEQIVNLLAKYIPQDLIMPFVSYISLSDISSLSLVISLLSVSIWVASKSFYSFLLLASEDDGLDLPHFFLRILALVYFIIFIVVLIAVGLLVSFIPIGSTILLPLLLLIFFLFFYRILSFNKLKLVQLIWGSLFSTVAMVLVGRLFFIYINSFSNYENIYGPLASFMIVLISVWVISYIVFVGYSINRVFGDMHKADSLDIFSRFERK